MQQIEEIPSTIRVLIIDDDEDDALILNRQLHNADIEETTFEVRTCQTIKEALKRIRNNEADVYLVDYRLGERTGLDLLNEIEAKKRSEPFILTTGAQDQGLLTRSMKAAASDFLIKGTFGADMLAKTITYALQRKYLEQQRLAHLVELNRSKDEFISIASHQLRTPATGVKQYIGMLREGFCGELTPMQQKLVEKAHESNERQLQIVSDLLRVARLDAGKISLAKQKTNLETMVKEVRAGLTGTFAARRQQLEVVVNKPTEALVDHDTMRMVIENLAENASKYSEEGKTITIKIENYPTEAIIYIIDEGVGVNKEERDNLFQKFVRIPNPLSTKVGGTGLGLYWAKKIIDLHGGTIEYLANQPQGSIFKIVLPHQMQEGESNGADD